MTILGKTDWLAGKKSIACEGRNNPDIPLILQLFVQIPLGILLKSETSYNDMMDILDHYQNYVPSVSCEKDIPDTGRIEDNHFLTTLVGGDYLSVARARGAQLIRSTSELEKHKLNGILPVAEDWHAKVCFMEV